MNNPALLTVRLVGGGGAVAVTHGHVSGADASGGRTVLLCTCTTLTGDEASIMGPDDRR